MLEAPALPRSCRAPPDRRRPSQLGRRTLARGALRRGASSSTLPRSATNPNVSSGRSGTRRSARRPRGTRGLRVGGPEAHRPPALERRRERRTRPRPPSRRCRGSAEQRVARRHHAFFSLSGRRSGRAARDRSQHRARAGRRVASARRSKSSDSSRAGSPRHRGARRRLARQDPIVAAHRSPRCRATVDAQGFAEQRLGGRPRSSLEDARPVHPLRELERLPSSSGAARTRRRRAAPEAAIRAARRGARARGCELGFFPARRSAPRDRLRRERAPRSSRSARELAARAGERIRAEGVAEELCASAPARSR